MEQLIRRADFARRMGVAPETVDRWVRKGIHGLKKKYVGGASYIDVSAFKPTDNRNLTCEVLDDNREDAQ